jgi:hypothetical protein
MDLHAEVPISSLALTPEESLQRRLMARYYAQDKTAAKIPPPPPPGFVDDGEGATVTGASDLPGGNQGGPGKRNIPKNHPYDPKALKPLSRMLWAMSVSLGHALAAYRQFTRLKSATISPDGMLGGRGYVMQVKEIRDKLHDACENLSSISDTIHDEIHAPHWEPQMAQLPPEEAVDVKKFLDESKQILNNPEEDAEDDMEAISDSAGEDEVSPEGEVADEGDAEEGTESDGVEDPTLDESEATPEDTAEGEAESDAQESETAPEGEAPSEDESAPEDKEAPSEDEGSDNPFEDQPDEENPEEAPAEEDEVPEADEGTPDDHETDDEVPDEYKDEDAPEEETSDEDEVPTDPEAGQTDEPPDSEEEQDDLEDEGSDNPFDDQPDDAGTDEEEESPPDEDEDAPSPDDITEEDEAAADAALEGSGLPGAGEPPAKTLGNPKPKKKKKKQKFSPSPPSTETVQDQKFAPEMRMASYHRGNSSLPVDTLPGPRVDHLDRAEDGRGPFDSYNEDEPRVTDDYGLSDGAKYDYPYTSPWENDTRHASVKMSADTHRTLKALVEKGWSEERILASPMAKRMKLSKEHIEVATSGLPDDLDTETEGWDLGLGWGARGQGAGGYENPSGEGNGTKGVLGPTSGLPSDPGGGGVKEDSTSEIEGEANGHSSSKSLMPTDVEAPVARSDYFNEGLSDEMIATSELPAPPSIQYNYDRDLPNKSEMLDQQDTPYARYDYTTHNYRPDPVFSRPER